MALQIQRFMGWALACPQVFFSRRRKEGIITGRDIIKSGSADFSLIRVWDRAAIFPCLTQAPKGFSSPAQSP